MKKLKIKKLKITEVVAPFVDGEVCVCVCVCVANDDDGAVRCGAALCGAVAVPIDAMLSLGTIVVAWVAFSALRSLLNLASS